MTLDPQPTTVMSPKKQAKTIIQAWNKLAKKSRQTVRLLIIDPAGVIYEFDLNQPEGD